MNTTRLTDALLQQDVSTRSVVLVLSLTTVIAISEASLFYGYLQYAIWTYCVLLIALSLAPLAFEVEAPIFQAFALIPVFRLVNLSMPVFFELTLLWFPLVYGPFIPVFVYIGWRASTDDAGDQSSVESADERRATTEETGLGLPWWLGGTSGGKLRWLARRTRTYLTAPDEPLSTSGSVRHWGSRILVVVAGLLVALANLVSLFVLTVYLAEIEYGIITPAPLIPSLELRQVAVLAVVMVGFVGFVEELLFRGVLQRVLERRLGMLPGLLLASALFGLMHSVYGSPMAILFASVVGLLFGVLYDVTDSLVLVSVTHGLMNVFLFGIIPLTGTSAIELLRVVVDRELRRAGWRLPLDAVSVLDGQLLLALV